MRTVERSLKAILHKSPMNEEVLHTVFTEAERIANSRPLTLNPSSPGDNDHLTPSHFLNVLPSLNIPPNVIDERVKFSRKRWRQAQLLADHYWKRWMKEYLPSLQERPKCPREQNNLKVGDLVLIADDNVNRNQWPLGRVVNVQQKSSLLKCSEQIFESLDGFQWACLQSTKSGRPTSFVF